MKKFSDLPAPASIIATKDVLTFGKYKNETVQVILDGDPAYLLWVHNNVEGYRLSAQLYQQATEAVKAKKRRYSLRNHEDEDDDTFNYDMYSPYF